MVKRCNEEFNILFFCVIFLGWQWQNAG